MAVRAVSVFTSTKSRFRDGIDFFSSNSYIILKSRIVQKPIIKPLIPAAQNLPSKFPSLAREEEGRGGGWGMGETGDGGGKAKSVSTPGMAKAWRPWTKPPGRLFLLGKIVQKSLLN